MKIKVLNSAYTHDLELNFIKYDVCDVTITLEKHDVIDLIKKSCRKLKTIQN
jgi:hypothetical protein